jgi:hypothetical protein
LYAKAAKLCGYSVEQPTCGMNGGHCSNGECSLKSRGTASYIKHPQHQTSKLDKMGEPISEPMI